MDAHIYQTMPYKLVAAASHAAERGSWSYYAERLRRRVTHRTVHFYSAQETEAVYGPYAHEQGEALAMVGLPCEGLDPRAAYPALFEQGIRRISRMSIPFHHLGLAGASDLRLLYSAAIGLDARDILETGVALGWSSLAFLKAAEKTGGRLVSVDLPYPFLIGRSWVGAAVPPELHANWTLLRQSDRSGIPRAMRLSDGYDLIHYDSDKSPQGRLWAYPRLWAALRPGGLLLSDDVGDNGAWAEFCRDVGVPLVVAHRQRAFMGVARKPGAFARAFGPTVSTHIHSPTTISEASA